jgi:hypothetical protein
LTLKGQGAHRCFLKGEEVLRSIDPLAVAILQCSSDQSLPKRSLLHHLLLLLLDHLLDLLVMAAVDPATAVVVVAAVEPT